MTDNPSGATDNACYRTPRAPAKPALTLCKQDEFLLNAWLHGRPATTARAYRADLQAFLRHSGKPLADTTLADLQAWDTALAAQAPASRARRLAAVRSLLAYAHKLGAVSSDPGRQMRVSKSTAGAPRALSETDVQRMIAAEPEPRRRAALRLLYVTGVRNAELCALRWRDLGATRKGGAEARITGKGGKLRTVLIPQAVWAELRELAPAARPDDAVIAARDGTPIRPRALHRLVRRAARRIGLAAVSPHWLRHAHASHALDRGAPVHVVQQGLGHASLNTTTRYLHVRTGDSAGAYLPA